MAIKTKVFSLSLGGCCACESTVGCGCDESCSLLCRSAAGTATLCGFSEFTDPSTPPKKYRRKETSGAGVFTICASYDDNTCTPPDCPGSRTFAFSGYIAGIPFLVTGTGSITLTGTASGVSTYAIECEAYIDNGNGPGGGPENGGATIRGTEVGGSGTFTRTDGTTVDLTEGTEWNVYLYMGYGGLTQLGPGGCILAGYPGLSATWDDWDLIEQYGATTCDLVQTDLSTRTTASAAASCDTPSGSAGALPCDNPTECYGSGASATEDATERTVSGLGCVGSGSSYQNYSGDVTESLSDEDTEDDAIEREAPAEGEETWSGDVSCFSNTAFITEREGFEFGFRRVQVKGAVVSGTVGLTYTVRINFYRRVLGSSGAFTFFGYQEVSVTVTADVGGSQTDWIDVPNEAGWETRAQDCTSTLVE